MWKFALLSLLLALASSGAAYHYGSEHTAAAKDRDFQTHLEADRTAEREAERLARVQETKLVNALAAIDAAYEKGKEDGRHEHEKLVADLRAGTVRLRSRWQQCEASSNVPGTATGSGGTDAGAADREESAARIVRAARDADERIKALQNILRVERLQPDNK